MTILNHLDGIDPNKPHRQLGSAVGCKLNNHSLWLKVNKSSIYVTKSFIALGKKSVPITKPYNDITEY